MAIFRPYSNSPENFKTSKKKKKIHESHKLSTESLVTTIQLTIRVTNIVKYEANNYLKCLAFVAIMRRSVNERVAVCFLINVLIAF